MIDITRIENTLNIKDLSLRLDFSLLHVTHPPGNILLMHLRTFNFSRKNNVINFIDV